MATSEAQIANMALARIGVKKVIAALTDTPQEAVVANLFFASCRDAVLELAPWPFAMKRADLGLLTYTRTGWTYAYALPSDCLAPRHIVNPSSRNPQARSRIPFAIETADDLGSSILLTDQPDAELAYTAKVTAVGRFSALFVDALAWKLGAEMAMPLSVKGDIAARCQQMLAVTVNNAFAASLNQQQEDPEPDSEFITVRG